MHTHTYKQKYEHRSRRSTTAKINPLYFIFVYLARLSTHHTMPTTFRARNDSLSTSCTSSELDAVTVFGISSQSQTYHVALIIIWGFAGLLLYPCTRKESCATKVSLVSLQVREINTLWTGKIKVFSSNFFSKNIRLHSTFHITKSSSRTIENSIFSRFHKFRKNNFLRMHYF